MSDADLTGATSDDGYRLAEVRPTAAPSGSAEADWLIYRIAQGSNVITGYRRGDVRAVTADLERMVDGLNERRIVNRGRVDLTAKSRALPVVVPPPRGGVDTVVAAAEAPFAGE